MTKKNLIPGRTSADGSFQSPLCSRCTFLLFRFACVLLGLHPGPYHQPFEETRSTGWRQHAIRNGRIRRSRWIFSCDGADPTIPDQGFLLQNLHHHLDSLQFHLRELAVLEDQERTNANGFERKFRIESNEYRGNFINFQCGIEYKIEFQHPVMGFEFLNLAMYNNLQVL